MYEFDLSQAISEIKSKKPKRVLLHLPDGLKPKADKIQAELEKEIDSEIMIWAGSCYGACDLPIEAKNVGVDMIVHFGHTKWRT